MRRVFVVVAALALCAYAQEEGAEEEKIEETAPQEESRKEKAEKYVYCESDNCYDLLGVKKDAGGLTIKRAYRRLATEWHPDRNPDPRAKDLFQKFANAYEVLSNSEMRKNYDYVLANPCAAAAGRQRKRRRSAYSPAVRLPRRDAGTSSPPSTSSTRGHVTRRSRTCASSSC